MMSADRCSATAKSPVATNARISPNAIRYRSSPSAWLSKVRPRSAIAATSFHASHQPEGESTAEDRPLHRGGRRYGVGKNAAGEVGGLDQPVFEHQRRRSESVHDQTEHGVGDPAAQQADHFVGGVGVAHGPVQIGDARGTPTHQIDLTELIGIEGGEHIFGLRGIALPQEARPRSSLPLRPAPRLTAARESRSPRAMLLRAMASRAAPTSRSTSGTTSLSRVSSASRIRCVGAVIGWRCRARASSPRTRRAAAIPSRRLIASPNRGWVKRTSIPSRSSARRIKPRASACSTASAPAMLGKDVEVERFAKGHQPQNVHDRVRQRFDASIEQRGQLGGHRGAAAQLPYTANLSERARFQRTFDEVPDIECVACRRPPTSGRR